MQAATPPYLIRNYRPTCSQQIHPTPHSHRWLLREAIIASTATPHFYAPLSIESSGNTYKFQDAGLSGWSNPAGIAWDEAKFVFANRRINILLSMGNGLPNIVGPDVQLGNSVQGLVRKLENIANDTEKVHESLSALPILE